MLINFKNEGIFLINPIKLALVNIWEIYKIKRLKAILIIILIFSLTLLSFIVCKKVFNNSNYTDIPTPRDNYIKNSIGLFETDKTANFIGAYENVIKFFSPIFESFISSTADPTGKSYKENDKYIINFRSSSKVIFNNKDSAISSEKFSNLAFEIVIPLLTLLILVNGFNYIYNAENNSNEISEFFKRLILTLSALILTPFFLSISIVSINLISQKFTDDKPLSTFIINFLDEIKNDKEKSTPDNLKNKLDNLINASLFNIPSFIESLPVLIPFTLIIILFLAVAFQFIIRFLNLFFLSCIYPFVMIFYLNSNTSQIPHNFWKQWFIYLLHQPAFIIGYSIIQSMLDSMLRRNGASFVQVLLFLSLLLFLTTINMITSAIFLDIYNAASSNIENSFSSVFTKLPSFRGRHRRYSPFTYVRRILGYHKRYGYNSLYRLGGLRSIVTYTRRGMSLGRKLGKLLDKTGIFGPNTDISKRLTSQSYSVKNANFKDGILGVSGTFFSYKNPKTNLSTLYTSEKNALQDGVDSKQLNKLNFENLRIKDLSNRQTTKEYNDKIKLYGMKNKIDTSKFKRFSGFSSEKSISENMNVFSSFNKENLIDGLSFQKTNKNIGGDQRFVKLLIYPKE